MLNSPVLLLNSTFEPLNVISVKRAMRLLTTSKANVLDHHADELVGMVQRTQVHVPTVVRLMYYVKRPHQRVKFTKQTILARDGYTCAYCGVRSRSLTLDHVVPKIKGGLTTWQNIVACCTRCNAKKGHKTVKEAGMTLNVVPREPRFLPYLRWVKHVKHESWDKYLFTDPDSPYLIYGPLPGRD